MATNNRIEAFDDLTAAFYNKKFLARLEQNLEGMPIRKSEWVVWAEEYFRKKGMSPNESKETVVVSQLYG